MGFLEERDFTNVQSIPEFYKDKTIFITGGTGFMGKVLVEKLLYSCTDLDRIYILIRSKKGVKSEDRLNDLYSSHCFDRLRNEKPGIFESKVFVLPGDVTENGFGLSEEDRALIINRVNIIFHVAASVRFDDPLTVSSRINLKGTKEMLDFAKEMAHLLALVHVSTSYSNTNRDPIEEVMYPPHADWRDTLRVCEHVDEHTLRVLTPKYLGELPNTYTFTKQLAEHMVNEQHGKLPAIIIRPSIVISSISEPIPGWVENFNGPIGIAVATGKGILRSMYSNPDITSDFLPVDTCIKNMIAASWARGTKPLEPTDEVEIYNCCNGNLNCLKMGEMVRVISDIVTELPLNDIVWNFSCNLTTSKTIHYIKVILFHLLPALLIDAILWLLGKKTMVVKIQRKIYIANMCLEYYATKQWTFKNKNFLLIRSRIKEEDKEQFFYKYEDVNLQNFFNHGIIGCRRFVLNESDEDLPKARAHLKRLKILDRVVKFLFYGCLLWWFSKLSFTQNLFENICKWPRQSI